MNAVTMHRGPDDTNTWVGDKVSLGHNRLAIIDLSPRGRQPMWDNKNEVAVVFNGEIFNFKELRKSLEAKYQFISQSDTEVIIYAYKEYGVECFKKFNGIFALAIYDLRNQELILARDRMGVNLLYYYFNPSAPNDKPSLIFSSEIKAILAHDILREVDNEAFNLYTQLLYVPEPYTMFKGVFKLPPAHYLRFKNNSISLTRYWQVSDFTNYSTYEQVKNDIKNIFKDSVRGQLISDRPVGVFLSGGIDSTAVLGAVSELHQGKIKTYSVGFKQSLDSKKFNADFELARATAKHYQTDHHELLIGPNDVQNNLQKMAWHLDEPNSNATAGAMYLLSEVAKKDVAVVLGGDGGDELFGGYPRYYYSALISVFQRQPKVLQKFTLQMYKLLGINSAVEKLSLPPNALRVAAFLCQKTPLLNKVVNSAIVDPNASVNYLTQKYFSPAPNTRGDFEKQFMQVDGQSWLPNESLLRTNKMCLAFGLEPRVPVLDYRLVEIAAKIPTNWKFSLWQRPSTFLGKRIWRDAIHNYLPPHVLNQQKRGWFTPMSKWLRGGLKDFTSEILSPNNLPADYFNVAEMQKVWSNHLDSKEYNLNIIWATVMWVLWYKEFIKK